MAGSGHTVIIRWLESDGSDFRQVSSVGHHFDGTYYLRRGIDSTHPMPSILVTWWAILFLLSTLAQYEPAGWTHFLDNERSPIATELEGALDPARLIACPGCWWKHYGRHKLSRVTNVQRGANLHRGGDSHGVGTTGGRSSRAVVLRPWPSHPRWPTGLRHWIDAPSRSRDFAA